MPRVGKVASTSMCRMVSMCSYEGTRPFCTTISQASAWRPAVAAANSRIHCRQGV